MTKATCPGSGEPAVPSNVIYPACSVCGREMSAQGRKAQRRYANAWKSVPRHLAEAK